MPIAAPLIGAAVGIGGSIISGNAAKKASKTAAAAQKAANDAAIAEQRRQFDITQDNFAPYLGAGTSALGKINNLLGISTPTTTSTDWAAYVNGNPDALANWNAIKGTSSDKFGGDIASFGQYHYGADGAHRDLTPYTITTGGQADQQGAINALMTSPEYRSIVQNGEDAILANASATGGLRGGNTQGALARFRADALVDAIQRQLANLGGIASMGQGAAGAVGNLGAGAANSISSLTQNTGATQGAAALARGAATGGIVSGIASSLGGLVNSGGIKGSLGNLFSSGGGSPSPIVMGGAYNNFMNGGIKL